MDTEGNERKFQLGRWSWVLFGCTLIIQFAILFIGMGNRESSGTFLIQFLINGLTILVLPLVLSYLLWIAFRLNTQKAGLVFNFGLLVVLAWLTSKELSQLQNINSIMEFSRDHKNLQKEIESNQHTQEDYFAIKQKIFSANTNYLAQMASRSKDKTKLTYDFFLLYLVESRDLKNKFHALSTVLDNNFMDYPKLRTEEGVTEKLALVDEYVLVASQLREQGQKLNTFIQKLTQEKVKMGALEARILDEVIMSPELLHFQKSDPYYEASYGFGQSIRILVRWISQNTEHWEFKPAEDGNTGDIEINNTDALKEFTELYKAAQLSLSNLNALTNSQEK